jgi:hypothetical protein
VAAFSPVIDQPGRPLTASRRALTVPGRIGRGALNVVLVTKAV